MIERLKKLLKQEQVDSYKILQTKKESFQLFFVHTKVETVRCADSSNIEVEVYIKHDDALGDASFVIYPTQSDEEILLKIRQAKEKAMSISNQPYKLVSESTGSYENEKLISGKSLKEVAFELADAIFEVKGNEGSALNATEIFINKKQSRVVNSDGVDKSSISYTGMIETIPTFNKKDESVETYAQRNFNTYNRKELQEYISSLLKEVEARANATKITLDPKLDVTIKAEEIETVLNVYLRQLNYASLYTKSNVLKKGDKIQTSKDADLLTISACGNVKGCSNSAYFDEDGSEYNEQVLIKDGEVVNFFGGNRYSQYVNEKNTGNLRIIKLNTGKLEKKDLVNDTYLECLQFSGIQSDLLNDYIGGEVRLAILHKDGKEIPVTGFSISGKLSDALNSIKLSKEVATEPNYCGPKFVLLKNLTIL